MENQELSRFVFIDPANCFIKKIERPTKMLSFQKQPAAAGVGSKCSLMLLGKVWVILDIKIHFTTAVSQFLINLDLVPQKGNILK